MNKKIKGLFLLAMTLFCGVAFAEHGWQRTNYVNSTTFTGIVTVNGHSVDDGDYIGIFSMDSTNRNLECRMIAEVFNVGDKSLVSSVIHGVYAEPVSIRYWNAADDAVYEFDTTFYTMPGGDLRNVPLNLRTKSYDTKIFDANVSKEKSLELYPSLAIDNVTISASKEFSNIDIFDNLGVQVAAMVNQTASLSVNLNVQFLPTGLYFATVKYVDGTIETKRLYKK